MRRVYQIYHPDGKKLPPGIKKYVRVRLPKDAPTATHWIWWGHGYLDHNPDLSGQIDVYDQTIGFPIRRLQ